MGTYIGLSMGEFKAKLEELKSEGLKFDVKSQGEGNISLSLLDCDVSVYQENEELCGEIIISKPEANVKISFEFDTVSFVYREDKDDISEKDDVEYFLQMNTDMNMSDITISISK